MKKIIDGIIVVEGKSDVSFLNEFLDAEFVTTNGSEIPLETINYLKNRSKNTNIYVLTDPDSPGKRIRDILDQNIVGLHHCFVSKEKSIKHHKVGVAESTKDEVIHALENYITFNKNKVGNVTMSDLLNIGLIGNDNSIELRNKISNKFNLGHCNAKTFLKRINACNINIEEIRGEIYE